MPKICYVDKKFQRGSLVVIARANEILEEYTRKGFDLTLRQLFYQFVAHNLLPNSQRAYKQLGSIINDARLAGLIDWDHIVDRTRNLRERGHWSSPANIIRAAATSYHLSMWEDQRYYVECWIEKDSLLGVIANVCERLDVPYFSCRGYSSQSEMWRAAMRLGEAERRGKRVVILHLSDHDPSGIDMSRDIQERLEGFGVGVDFRRLALTMVLVKKYNLPPNPTKVTDTRAQNYTDLFGENSWELDALDPEVIEALISSEVADMVDGERWSACLEREREGKRLLECCSSRWGGVEEFLEETQQ